MENKEIVKELSKPLPKEAIQRTKGKNTNKPYDTSGFGYQSCVDRFNEVLGEKWGFDSKIIKEIEGVYKNSGKPYIDITVDVGIWIINNTNIRRCVGNHTGLNYGDALKGAITNGFKKTSAFWGVGREAYAGELDDDNKPLPDRDENKIQQKKNGKGMALDQYNKFYNFLSDDYKFELKDMNDAERFELFAKCEWDIKKLDEEIIKKSKELVTKNQEEILF